MNAKETIEYLSKLSLTRALWWYIENISTNDPVATEVFFYLRERVRNEL